MHITSVKNSLNYYENTPISLRVKTGRGKWETYEGTVSKTYSHVFILYTEKNQYLCFKYSDIISGQVHIQTNPAVV